MPEVGLASASLIGIIGGLEIRVCTLAQGQSDVPGQGLNSLLYVPGEVGRPLFKILDVVDDCMKLSCHWDDLESVY